MEYDYFTINFFPLTGIAFLMIFLWRNSYLEKQIRRLFYSIISLILAELLIYNLELYLSTIHSSKFMLTLATALGYTIRPLILYLLISLITRNDERQNIKKVLLIPFVVNMAFSFSAFFTDLTFYYDIFSVFHRGPLGWTPHIVTIIYLLSMVTLSFTHTNKPNKFEQIIIIEITLILIAGTLAESFFSSYIVLRTAITASLIFYYMFFQSQIYKDEIIEKHIEQTKMIERFTLQMVTALAGTVDAKDSYTNGHSLRVAEYSKEIAKRLGKDENFQRRIYYMGMLHDIGKIGIPDEIIHKTGKLTEEEFEIVKSHPIIGEEVLKNITEMPNLYYAARWHHERYDGKGYPDGLKGEEIPLEARIVAVADIYDAMTSKRSYRDVLPQSSVRSEAVKAKGTQLDPELADIMIEMIDEDKEYKMREHYDK